jgi:ATP-dependent Clp protease protease subunit
MKKFWKWKNQAEAEERVLELNGTIAEESWFDDDITPRMFKEELYSGTGPITIWINSPGGDCIAASQIYSMLMDYKGEVTVKIDGIAASAASVIAMAGTKVVIAPTALIMIHNPSTSANGDHRDMSKTIEVLNEVKESIINAYEIKTGLSRAVLSHMMDAVTWMNANKAIELGFADEILEDEKKKDAGKGFEFQEHVFAEKLLNKITGKETKAKPTNKGRSIAELKEKLDQIKKLI